MFAPLAPMLTGHSFLAAMRDALDADDAGLDSTPNSPVLRATTPPVDSDHESSHSMDVPRTSISVPQPSSMDEHVVLPSAPSERGWSDGSSDGSTDTDSNSCAEHVDASTNEQVDEDGVDMSLPRSAKTKKKCTHVVDESSRATKKQCRGVKRRA